MSIVSWKTGRVVKVPTSNVQITYDSSPKNARSECVVAVNPLNSNHVVCASKRFRAETPPDVTRPEPESYEFQIAPLWSEDGGFTWHEAELQRKSDWANTTDPALAWDTQGNVYLLVLPLGPAPALDFLGVAIYRSTDGGKTWGAPNHIHLGAGDDKGWMTTDASTGRVYAAWDDTQAGAFLGFARTVGLQWKGPGSPPGQAGGHVPNVIDSFSPTLSVTDDGTLWIFWIAGTTVKYVTSGDGGGNFTGPQPAAVGITPLSTLNIGGQDGWPEFPGTTFRVETFPTSCAVGNAVIVAWTDAREKHGDQTVARIYYRRYVPGQGWVGDASGQTLLKGGALPDPAGHAFHPQLATASDGTIGCGFYELSLKGQGGKPLIDVVLATPRLGKPLLPLDPFPQPGLLSQRTLVTDSPWDPAIDAPWAHGDKNVTFIGDYFGVCAAGLGWDLVWTDTRTGIQELFFSRVEIEVFVLDIPDAAVEILFGVTQDGGGIVITPGGHPVPIPPRGPVREALIASMIGQLAKRMARGEPRAAIELVTKELIAAGGLRRS